MRIIVGDVLTMNQTQLVDGSHDLVDSTWLTHLLRGEVGVTTSSIPISLDRLTVQRGHYSVLFGHAMKNESGHPQLVPHIDSFHWSYLEFPLKTTISTKL